MKTPEPAAKLAAEADERINVWRSGESTFAAQTGRTALNGRPVKQER